MPTLEELAQMKDILGDASRKAWDETFNVGENADAFRKLAAWYASKNMDYLGNKFLDWARVPPNFMTNVGRTVPRGMVGLVAGVDGSVDPGLWKYRQQQKLNQITPDIPGY